MFKMKNVESTKIVTNELIERTKKLKSKVEKLNKPKYDEASLRKEAEEIYNERLNTISQHGTAEVHLLHKIYEDELIERYRRISKYLRLNHSKRVSDKVIENTIDVLKKVTLNMSPDGHITDIYIDGISRKIYQNTNGYECIYYKKTWLRVSRIYAMLYITIPNRLVEFDGIICVDHIDDNCINNNINNLQWLTNSENIIKGKQGKETIYKRYTYIVVEDNVEFNSGREVAEHLGVVTLQDYFCGKCKTIGGKTIIRHLRD